MTGTYLHGIRIVLDFSVNTLEPVSMDKLRELREHIVDGLYGEKLTVPLYDLVFSGAGTLDVLLGGEQGFEVDSVCFDVPPFEPTDITSKEED